MAHKQCY